MPHLTDLWHLWEILIFFQEFQVLKSLKYLKYLKKKDHQVGDVTDIGPISVERLSTDYLSGCKKIRSEVLSSSTRQLKQNSSDACFIIISLVVIAGFGAVLIN